MPRHEDPALDALREAYLDAQATCVARISDTRDAAEELTETGDAARAYEVACRVAGIEPRHEGD